MRIHFTIGFGGVFDAEKQDVIEPRTRLALSSATHDIKIGALRLWLIGDLAPTAKFIGDDGALLVVKGRPFLRGNATSRLPAQACEMDRFLQSLDGRFGLLAVTTSGLHLATDLIGSSALYVHRTSSNRVTFATHLGLLLELIPESPALDHHGVAGALFGNCSPSQRTPYMGVQRIRAASRVLLTSTSYSEHEYLDLADVLLSEPVSRNSALEAFDTYLRESLSREERTGVRALMLSGGNDSQAIAHAWRRSVDSPLKCYTFGEWRSTDVRGAREFAAALGVRHSVLPFGSWRIEDYADEIVRLNAGLSGLHAAQALAGYDHAQQIATTAMVGFLGDAATGAHLPKPEQDFTDPIFPFASRFVPEAQKIYSSELADLRDELTQSLHRYRGLEMYQLAMLADFLVRQASYISSTFDLMEHRHQLAFPFFSRDLLKSMFSLPQEKLIGQKLYRMWLGSQRQALRWPGIMMLAYHAGHAILDRVSWRTGWFKPVLICDWQSRMRADRPWIENRIASFNEPRLRRMAEIQLELARNSSELTALHNVLAMGMAASRGGHF